MKMNAREKFLFIVLAAVIILFGGFKFLIEPEITNFKNVGEEYAMQILNKMKSEKNVLEIDKKKSDNETLIERAETISAPFFPELKNDKIHLFFQEIAVNTGINFKSFSMTRPITAQITSPAKDNKETVYPAKDNANTILDIINGKYETKTEDSETSTTKSGKNTATTSKKPIDTIEMMPISCTFTCSFEQSKVFIDAVKNSNRLLRISQLKFTNNNDGTIEVNLNIECFGIKKFIEGDVLEKDSLSLPTGKANPFG